MRGFVVPLVAGAVVSLAVVACGPNQAKPPSTAQKAHAAVTALKSLTPLQVAAAACTHGLLGAAKDQGIEYALKKLFQQAAGKDVAGGVFTGFEVVGDTVKVDDELSSGQVASATFDLGRVIYAILGVVPETKLFGIIGEPAIDCLEAAWWLDGTLGGQLGTMIRLKLHPPPVSTAVLASHPSAISGSYTLYRRLKSCIKRSAGCFANPMKLRVTCSALACTIIRTNNAPGYPPWTHTIPLAYGNGAWRASGREDHAATCNHRPEPSKVSFLLKVVSGSIANGVWRAKQLRGTYKVVQGPESCNNYTSSTGAYALSTQRF